ncbi:MAG TPA: outer membrane beta-barrel protein [Patescibacteria group bacterium]|nr:outer membrane beta-barrel protein [Patescibacteria group bacterium]
MCHDEFAISLGLVEVKIAEEKFRGRFALQSGTYVEANYAAEPEIFRFIYDASACCKNC